jgi:DNA polymerase-3 subunit alpha/error-prone DNA polymerase
MVITPEPTDRYVPVELATKGVPIIQWGKDAAEDGGLVKIDLLGNRSLGVIRDAIANPIVPAMPVSPFRLSI